MHGTFYSRRDEVHGIGKGNDDINGVVWEDHGAIDQKANESPIAPVKMRVSYICHVQASRSEANQPLVQCEGQGRLSAKMAFYALHQLTLLPSPI